MLVRDPWKPSFQGRHHCGGSSVILTEGQDIYISAEDDEGGRGHFCADPDFTAHARQDLPRLIADVARRSGVERMSVYRIMRRIGMR